MVSTGVLSIQIVSFYQAIFLEAKEFVVDSQLSVNLLHQGRGLIGEKVFDIFLTTSVSCFLLFSLVVVDCPNVGFA